MSKEAEPPIPYVGQIFPPYPTAIHKIRAASASTKAFNIIGMFVFLAVVGTIIWFVGRFFDWNWLKYGGVIVCVWIFFGISKSVLKSHLAPCPFCNGVVGKDINCLLLPGDQNKQVHCEHCEEWLLSDQGEVRAFREEDVTTQKDFDCPSLKEGRWPNECVACGAPPVRFLEASNRKFNVTSLAIGRISVSSGSIKNIPYCAAHEDAVSVKIVDDKLRVVFHDYSARRRFLHVNRSRAGDAYKMPAS